MKTLTVLGQSFNVTGEPADIWDWIENRGWGIGTYQALKKYLTPATTFVDLGAWVGPFTVFAMPLCKRVIAVEPDPVAFKILVENGSLNAGRAVWPALAVPEAVSGHDGELTLSSGALGASTTRVNFAAGANIGAADPNLAFTVPCSTIGTFAKKNFRDSDKLFLKIDVEGSEEDIFGDFEWFKANRPAFILSMHPFWFQRKDAEERIKKVLQLYTRVEAFGHYDVLALP